MLGQMGMAKDIDAFSAEHGKMMLSEARAVIAEIMEGTGMKEMHAHGVKKDDAMMAETHKMSEASVKVIDLLSKMPAAGSK